MGEADHQEGTGAIALSGKGGTGKSFIQVNLASEASLAEIPTVLTDLDPELNLSRRFGVPRDAVGIGDVLVAAGVLNGDGEWNVEAAAAKLHEAVRPTHWPNVSIVPAGRTLVGLGQLKIEEDWLLREIYEEAGIPKKYRLRLFDTGGRRGSLVTQAMYASDAAYAPINDMDDAVTKALEARERVKRIQKAHPLRWAGVVITGIDTRTAINQEIRRTALTKFGAEAFADGEADLPCGDVRAEIPSRAAAHEAYTLVERMGESRDPKAQHAAGIVRRFLTRDVLQTEAAVA